MTSECVCCPSQKTLIVCKQHVLSIPLLGSSSSLLPYKRKRLIPSSSPSTSISTTWMDATMLSELGIALDLYSTWYHSSCILELPLVSYCLMKVSPRRATATCSTWREGLMDGEACGSQGRMAASLAVASNPQTLTSLQPRLFVRPSIRAPCQRLDWIVSAILFLEITRNFQHTMDVRWLFMSLVILCVGMNAVMAVEVLNVVAANVESVFGSAKNDVDRVSFLGQTQNVTVSKGRDALLKCSVVNLGGFKVGWVRLDTKAIQSIDKMVITHNARVTVSGDFGSTFNLNIAQVRKEDAGPYMCQVNTDPMISQTSHLEVLVSPEIVWSSGDVSVLQGRSARLTCRASGVPKPFISWRREDGKSIRFRDLDNNLRIAMRVETEQLIVPNVTPDDMAAYLCIAHNEIPPARSKRVLLYTQFAPIVEMSSPLVNAVQGSMVHLSCSVHAYPKPLIFWRHKGLALVNGSVERHLGDFKYISTLSFVQSGHQTDKDAKKYECVAENSIGVTAVVARVYIIARLPRETLRPTMSTLTAKSATPTTVMTTMTMTTTPLKKRKLDLEEKRRRKQNRSSNTPTGFNKTRGRESYISVVLVIISVSIMTSVNTYGGDLKPGTSESDKT